MHISQTSHLIDIFFTTVNIQQLPIITLETFLDRLQRLDVARALCHAICSISVRFTRHRSLRSGDLGNEFALDARATLSASQAHQNGLKTHNPESQLDQVLTLCTLSMYEAHRGNGLQAWFDISEYHPPYGTVRLIH